MNTSTISREASVRGRALSPAEAAARPWQVVIVGGGPAAAACGLAAAAGGLRVLLVERSRMPRAKLCGCCLSPRGQAELAKMGLRLSGASAGVPLKQLRLVTPSGQARIPFTGPHALSRDRLDSSLLGLAVDRGCHLLPETVVQSVAYHAGEARLTCRTGPDATDHDSLLEPCQPPAATSIELTAECVVLATGLPDSVRLRSPQPGNGDAAVAAPSGRIGLGATLPPHTAPLPPGELIMAVESFGYCGVVLLEDGRVDIAAAVDTSAVSQASPTDLLQTLLAKTGLGPLPLHTVRVRGTPPLTHRRRLTQGRVFRVGDEACYVEPFTGEGIGWALTSGRLAGEALAVSAIGDRLDHVAAARLYERQSASELAGSFRRCGLIAKAVRSPRLMRAALGGLRLAPWAGGPLVRLATGCRR